MLQHQITLCVLENFCENLCFCNRVVQNQVQLVAGAKFCCCDMSSNLLHQVIPNLYTGRDLSQQSVAATCCLAACFDVKMTHKNMGNFMNTNLGIHIP